MRRCLKIAPAIHINVHQQTGSAKHTAYDQLRPRRFRYIPDQSRHVRSIACKRLSSAFPIHLGRRDCGQVQDATSGDTWRQHMNGLRQPHQHRSHSR